MRKTFLPFSKPAISEAESEEVAKVLRSGWIITDPKAAAFEEALQKYCKAEEAPDLTPATDIERDRK